MKWASLGKWIGLIVAAIPHIIQAISIITSGKPAMDIETQISTSGVGVSSFLAGLGKESADNLNRTKLIVATEPNAIPVEKQDEAVKKMESGGKV